MNEDQIVLRLLKHDQDPGEESPCKNFKYISETAFTTPLLHTHIMHVTDEGIENPNNKHLLLIKTVSDQSMLDGFWSRNVGALWTIIFPDGTVGECNSNGITRAIGDSPRFFPIFVPFSIPRIHRRTADLKEWSIKMNAYLESL